MEQQSWMRVHLLTTWFTEYIKPIVETYCSDKNIPFKIVLTMYLLTQGSKELYNEIHVFMSANTTSILQSFQLSSLIT